MIKQLIMSATMAVACTAGAMAQVATFDYFKYEGKELRFNKPIDLRNQYFNPVVSGYYPDPSICRVGDTYYLVNSTFSYFPGVPIFKSNDLVNWQQIGHVLDRPSQVNLNGQDLNLGIYAPQISYNPKNKTYYMTTGDMGNGFFFYVKTKDPSKGWSEPIRMKHGGMDTSFFFDTDGKAYVVYNADPIEPAKYNMQKAIHMYEFDWKADTIKDQLYELTKGSTCIDNPIWIEGPHVFKRGKYYYLMAAESGTYYMHSEVIFRSKKPTGPYEECPHNPILTQRDLGMNNRPEAVSSTGHASMLEAPDGQWWAAFLGCRPYEHDSYNTGRETFLLPVTWKDGWPTILEHGKAVPTIVDKPGLKPVENNYVTGNFSFTDKFETEKLDYRWIFLRNPHMENYDWSGRGISLKAQPVNIYEWASPTAVFYRQKHMTFSAETVVNFTPTQDSDLAGLVVFQNDKHNFVMGKTLIWGKPALTLTRAEKEQVSQIGMASLDGGAANQPIRLKVEGDGRWYSFYYAVGNGAWQTLAQGVDAVNLSSVTAGGFVGTTIGLYATTKKNND